MRSVIFDVGRVLVHWDPAATLAGLVEISQAGPAELRSLWGWDETRRFIEDWLRR